MMIGRRPMLLGAVAAAAASATASAAAAAPASTAVQRAASPGEPSWQTDPVRTYVRVVADLAGADTYKWFSGQLHAALADGAIVPLVGFDAVIRRKAGAFDQAGVVIVFSEATVFHDLENGRVIDEFTNPVNGRRTRPLHYPEGPNPLPATPAMFAAGGSFSEWLVSGGTARFTRETRVDSPHPLDPAVWKLESSGPRFRALTLRSYSVATRDLANAALTSMPAEYSLTVLSGWLPWLLLGQTPGQLLWQAQGRKVTAVEEIPAAVRARIDRRFPELFAPVLPWREPMNFMRWHERQRRPE